VPAKQTLHSNLGFKAAKSIARGSRLLEPMRMPSVLRMRWFWCCVFCVACWVPWAILSKLGSEEIPAPTMQYLFKLGRRACAARRPGDAALSYSEEREGHLLWLERRHSPWRWLCHCSKSGSRRRRSSALVSLGRPW
jgi:hypothetical protein